MRKDEPVDEFAETEVLIRSEDPTDRETDVLLLYAEYERVLAREPGTRGDSRTGP